MKKILIPSIAYGTHVATTVVPLLTEISFGNFNGNSCLFVAYFQDGTFGPRTFLERLPLFGIYSIYLVFPLGFAFYVAHIASDRAVSKLQKQS